MKKFIWCAVFVAVVAALVEFLPSPRDASSGETQPGVSTGPNKVDKSHGIPARVPWTTSRIAGTPEPPHPFRIVRAFPKLHFRNPLHMTRAPGMNRWFVTEHQGKMYSFPMDEKCDKADLFLDVAERRVLGVENGLNLVTRM